MPKNKITKVEVKKQEHEWDGITEYDNPDPQWLRITFYITVFFALGYWIFYPSWPTPNDNGVLDWSSEKQLQEDLKTIYKIRQEYQVTFDKASFEEIMKDNNLMNYAQLSGQSIFQNNCAVCHGAGGGGNEGYPNLTAGAWLWGGKIEDIQQTITYGIRNGNPDARDSQMPAFGRDNLLSADDVKLMTDYVLYISKSDQGKTKETNLDLKRADEVFQANCASCHGANGKGNYIAGAPNLTDAIWLYGGNFKTIYDVIYNGRAGHMPVWKGKLTDSEIKSVALYVHQLGGGE
jgi:cytochrome c oxidase cbb3-type subunit 3